MAYLLRFAGGESVATATAIALSNAVGFKITLDAVFFGMSSGFLPIIGRDVASTQRIMFYGTSASNINGIRVGGNTNSAIPPFDWTTRKSVAIESTATTLKIIIDGLLHAEVARTISYSTLNEICKGATIPAAPSDLYGYQIEIGGALVHNYDPTASGGVGSTLIDTVGSNNGTLVNFPTDNSQWIYYDDGGSGTPFTGDILKSSLSVSNKSFLVSAGYNALAVKSSLTLSNDTLTANTGYNDDLLSLSIPLDNKPLDLSSGAILELQKNAYTINNKQLSVTAGSSVSFSGNLNKLSLNLSFKQLSASCGFNSAASPTTYPINYLPEDVEAGYSVEMLSDTLIVDGKPLTVSVGTEISFIGVLNKDSLTLSSKALSVEAGTVVPFTGDIQKQSLIISYKQLQTIRGHVLDVQRDTLSLVMKALTIGETIYPIVQTERLYSMKIQNTTYVIKLKNTIHVMKGK